MSGYDIKRYIVRGIYYIETLNPEPLYMINPEDLCHILDDCMTPLPWLPLVAIKRKIFSRDHCLFACSCVFCVRRKNFLKFMCCSFCVWQGMVRTAGARQTQMWTEKVALADSRITIQRERFVQTC